MASAAQIVPNVISRVKDYDLLIGLSGATPTAIEYSSVTLPGRGEASTYNLITNLRNIQESDGAGEYNALVFQIPMSLAEYKKWHDNYDVSGQVIFKSTIDSTLSAGFNVRVAGIGDFEGAFDSVGTIDITMNMISFIE